MRGAARRAATLLASVAMLPGCIAISTHERLMRRCQEDAQRAADLDKQISQLQDRNAQLEDQLASTAGERQRLQEEVESVRKTYEDVVSDLKDEIAKGELAVQETANGVKITVGNKILFPSGRAELLARGKTVLANVATALKKVSDRDVWVEGHTDNVPITGALRARYPSNWDLSAARSATVVRYLQGRGVDPAVLTLAGYGEYRPVADNKTAAGRQENRRVEITLRRRAKAGEPQP